jgi:hypothetical protein
MAFPRESVCARVFPFFLNPLGAGNKRYNWTCQIDFVETGRTLNKRSILNTYVNNTMNSLVQLLYANKSIKKDLRSIC